MNILDEKFAEFQKLPTEERIECFEKNGRLFDMIRSLQMTRGKKCALLFKQPIPVSSYADWNSFSPMILTEFRGFSLLGD